MPTPTYDLIASSVLGSSAATVTFSSIVGTYRDLVLVSTTSDPTSFYLQFNGDTGTNYYSVVMAGDGTTGSSRTYDATNIMYLNGWLATGAGLKMGVTHIMDYAQTNKHKVALHRFSQARTVVAAWTHRWANTASAVTSIVLTSTGSNFNAGSTFYLYGIVS